VEILAPISKVGLESWIEAMDVDSSSMVPETDHDPGVQNHNTASSPAAMEREQLGEASPAQSPPQPSSPQQQQPVPQVQQNPEVGPRHAPTYSVVNAVIEKKEDGPGPRCGHTLTAVAAVGEEGTPGYIGPRQILFGGATALEGNSAASGTPSSAGSAGIRMFLNWIAFGVAILPYFLLGFRVFLRKKYV
jgi:hypothetical protein